jgi:hypothetical protein
MNSIDENKLGNGRTIRYCVMRVLNDLRDYSMRDYKYIAQLVINGWGDMNIYHTESVRVKYLTPNEANIVKFPNDYIRYTKIGINVNGTIWTLTLNRNMVLPQGQECGVDINNTKNGLQFISSVNSPVGGFYFVDHWKRGQYVGGLYGVGGGINTAYYNIDEANRQIVLSNKLPRNELIVEYISNGLSENTIIPYQAVKVVINYVHWQRIEFDPRVPMSEKQRKKDLYEESVMEYRDLQLMFTMNEFLDSLYSSYIQAPKR